MFYVHMTSVTETNAMRSILSSGKPSFKWDCLRSDHSVSMRLNIQSQSAS